MTVLQLLGDMWPATLLVSLSAVIVAKLARTAIAECEGEYTVTSLHTPISQYKNDSE